MNNKIKRWIANLSLLIVAGVWGLTFVTVKNAIEIFPPYSFNFYRFSLSTLVMLVISLPHWKKLKKSTIKVSLLIGFVLFCGYSFQTVGLLYTTASNAGFITGLSVILVPLFITLSTKKKPGPGVILGSTFAAAGLALITLNEWSFNYGDILVLFCAVSFALHVILVGKYTKQHNVLWLVTGQIAAVALLSGIFAFFTEPRPVSITPPVWQALFITALFATCLAFFLQNYMQRFTTPSHTAIILAMEPVFTAIFAVILLQEILTRRTLWGGGLIFAGMILAEIKKHKSI